MKSKLTLPPDVLESDTKRPDYKRDLTWEKRTEMGIQDVYELCFYNVKGVNKFGWVLCTLHISKARGRQTTERFYAITLADEKLVRVGSGPHVESVVRVYPSLDNIKRLEKYFTLRTKGLELAGVVRDRISTRRAQGQIYRAQGRQSWTW